MCRKLLSVKLFWWQKGMVCVQPSSPTTNSAHKVFTRFPQRQEHKVAKDLKKSRSRNKEVQLKPYDSDTLILRYDYDMLSLHLSFWSVAVKKGFSNGWTRLGGGKVLRTSGSQLRGPRFDLSSLASLHISKTCTTRNYLEVRM